jgi:hypothetical protein
MKTSKELVMRLSINLSEQLLRTLMTGKRVPGSIRAERVGNEIVIGFYQYQRNRAKRRQPQTLLALPHGWVRKTPRRYRLSISLPDHLGERRCGELMANESMEARSFMNCLESVLNNV